QLVEQFLVRRWLGAGLERAVESEGPQRHGDLPCWRAPTVRGRALPSRRRRAKAREDAAPAPQCSALGGCASWARCVVRCASGAMAPVDAPMASRRLPPRGVTLVVVGLSIGGVAIGTSEFAVMGLMADIARGLGLTEPQVGHVISAYALGVVV